jgi:hypothetical protein
LNRGSQYDEIRSSVSGIREQFFQMRHVVVAENLLLASGLAHVLNYRIVVPGIRENEAVRQQPRDRGDAGSIGNISRSKNQRGFFAVQSASSRSSSTSE